MVALLLAVIAFAMIVCAALPFGTTKGTRDDGERIGFGAILLIAGCAAMFAAGSVDGQASTERDAVRAGCASYVEGEDGSPEFQWRAMCHELDPSQSAPASADREGGE